MGLSLACLGMTVWTPGVRAASDDPDIRRDATVVAVDKVLPCVVNIVSVSVVPVRDPFEVTRRQFLGRQLSDTLYSLGSGVIIDEAGYLLTNDHVVRGARQIGVQFNAGTNLYYEATVIASDPQRDVALLKLNSRPGETFQAIRLAREDDLLLGETVLALGNPFGLGGSVTRGILSSKSRLPLKAGAALDYQNCLQTDAPINEGNSGGPLINLRGELIGINVSVVNEVGDRPAQGLGFAIPIRLVEEALADILPTEYIKSWWFGARVKVGSYPLVVASVQAASPADRAGLKPGDTIVQVNGKAPRSFIEFGDLMATNAGSEAAITYRRGPDSGDLKVKLVPETSVFNEELVRRKLGLNLEPLTPEQAARLHVNASGFVVTGVEPGSPAATAGLREQMLIIAVDAKVITELTELAKLLYDKKPGEEVLVNVGVLQRAGPFNVWRPGATKIVPR